MITIELEDKEAEWLRLHFNLICQANVDKYSKTLFEVLKKVDKAIKKKN